MSLTLQFYNTKSNPKKINKTITAVGEEITLNPFEDFDLENPFVLLSNDTSVGNYAKIGSDYFFAEEPVLMTGERKMVRFVKDVLESNKSELLNLEVIPLRSANSVNSYIHDGDEIYTAYKTVQNYYFGELSFTADSKIILAAMGSRDVI